MPAHGLLRRSKLLAVLALSAAAIPAAPAAAQAPGLPRSFSPQVVDTPLPVAGGSFGWGLASADLNRDNKPDLLVAQGQAEPTRVFIFDGASGRQIDTIVPPELNPGGADPIIAFVYIETMPDVGSCPGGTSSQMCPNTVVGPGDGIPEIIVGARGKRVNVESPATPAVDTDPQLGRGYVLDGATRAVIKRIDMPLVDRRTQLTSGPQFGRVMASPQAMPPCAGSAAENNNTGIGPCPALPLASRIGDLDGDNKPDIVITARNFRETGAAGQPNSADPDSQCAKSAATTCTSGKAWAYSGGGIAGSDPRAILDTAIYPIQNPLSQTTGQEFGGNLYRIGDINSTATTNCDATPANATCAPEFVIPARNLSFPFFAPTQEFSGAGAAFMFNGRTGEPLPPPGASAAQPAITSPEPQKLVQFSGSFNGGRPVGDLGQSTSPDILLPAAFQNATTTGDGKIWAFNAVGFGGGATGSWQFASMTDPTPYPGSNFGGSFTGVGNIADGPGREANELLVGGFHFDRITEVSRNALADVHFVNVQNGANLMTIPNPDVEGGRGDGFGVGLIPMGDLNGDGFLDFAASSYLANGTTGGQGRAWIFRSDNSPLPQPPASAPPVAQGPAAPVATSTPTTQEVALRPGRCANLTVGTDAVDSLRGTVAGDQIFGMGGNDRIRGFQGQDCLDGGRGRDRLEGGNDADKIIGGTGNDRITGGNDRDRLYGGTGLDRLTGNGGNDMLAGGSSNDYIHGGIGNDELFGEAGVDRIEAGPGLNRIDAGAGNDSINARNGQRDRVICGTGRDSVRADSVDRLNGCERVTIGGKIR